MPRESTEFIDSEQPVDRLIASILVAMDAGQDIDPREWVERNPEFASELEEFFADFRVIKGRFKRGDAPDSTLMDDETAPGPAHDAEVHVSSFGRYTLLKKIGEGGQGEVWKALQSGPSRLVAIKIVKGGYLASAEEVRRFRDEAELISRLDHPHIIPVYEVGENDRHHYFSMKLIAGGSLINRLSTYQDRPEEAADLMIQVARAVQHAHEHGVIHRDLKPSNILCHAVGDSYLTDFGLAKRFGRDVEETQTESIQGTAA
jgi:serine/threonine-protein kinase